MIKLIASDLDGTLLQNNAQELNPEMFDIIWKLKEKGIASYICYVPLHSAPYGLKLGYTPEMLPVTEDLAKRILRLPLYVDMTSEDAMYVVDSIKEVLKG